MIALLVALAAPAELPFAVEPGSWWEYRESYTESLGALDSTSEDVTRFEVRALSSGAFLHQSGGFDPGSGPIEAGEGWLRLGPWTGEDPLPLPLEVGRAAPPGEGGAAWTVEAAEEVSVPAGTFRTLRCALRAPESESVIWIAPGVGVVRESHGRPGARPEIARVLIRWGGPSPAPDGSPRPR